MRNRHAIFLFLGALGCTVQTQGAVPDVILTAPVPLSSGANAPNVPPMDRHALVSRHNVVLTQFDPENPLTVGNGQFAFTVDATGLQTFPDAFAQTIPLCTMADWGWHSFPNPNRWSIDNFTLKTFTSHGRPVPYADVAGRATNPADQRTAGANTGNAQSNYLRENPHKFNLGQIGFVLTKLNGTPATPTDLTNIEQTLDLWNGTINSKFAFEGQNVVVETLCAPGSDRVAVRVDSPLIRTGQVAVQIRFPYASSGKDGSDWTKPNAHISELHPDTPTPNAAPGSLPAVITRTLDDTNYVVEVKSPNATLVAAAPHQFSLRPKGSLDGFDFSVEFYPRSQLRVSTAIPDISFAATANSAATHWNHFWSTGGAIDLSLSKDPRWSELERRIVLSEYLTAVQSTGKNPPAETGLTINSWYGKFHLEMYWWHDAHFALWDRAPLLENSLAFYARALPPARAMAQRQGYAGARWPKMTNPDGAESPSSVGPFLIWEQPHPIYLAELAYRAHPSRATLEQYQDVIFATADFMASYAWWDEAAKRYVLGPPLQAAQEQYDKATMFNPTFELVYWRWGLETAQKWRERLGLPRDEKWDAVLQSLSPLPVADGKYLFTESTPDSFTNPKWVNDHPSVLAALGVLPGPGVDTEIMRSTFDWIWTHWNWPDTWGWDYPMVAMTAARLGEANRAVDALLLDTPKNHYRLNGHNHQRMPDLPLYLPGNGGLLTAVAMMAAGWDGGPDRPAPGFPSDGSWVVRWENLQKMP